MGPNAPMAEQDVLRKVRLLMKKAEGGTTEAEASMLVAKAQELLAKYNLQMSQLDAAEPERASSAKRVKDTYTRSALFDYQRELWKAVAEANFCVYEPIPIFKVNTLGVRLKSNYHHFLIGREENVIATRIMGDYLEEMVSRLCPYPGGKPMFSWKEGCAARLTERLQAKRKEMEEQSQAAPANTGEMEIVLHDAYVSEDDQNYRFIHGEEAYQRRMRARARRRSRPLRLRAAA